MIVKTYLTHIIKYNLYFIYKAVVDKERGTVILSRYQLSCSLEQAYHYYKCGVEGYHRSLTEKGEHYDITGLTDVEDVKKKVLVEKLLK